MIEVHHNGPKEREEGWEARKTNWKSCEDSESVALLPRPSSTPNGQLTSSINLVHDLTNNEINSEVDKAKLLVSFPNLTISLLLRTSTVNQSKLNAFPFSNNLTIIKKSKFQYFDNNQKIKSLDRVFNIVPELQRVQILWTENSTCFETSHLN